MINITTTAATVTTKIPASEAGQIIQKNLSDAGKIIGLPENINFPIAVARLIRVGMSFVGLILLLLILSAGFTWMTSGGDEEKVKQAKKTLINAFVGLFLILSAYSITSGVINAILPK